MAGTGKLCINLTWSSNDTDKATVAFVVANAAVADITNDVAHCGGCNRPCSFPNGTAACLASQCTLAACQPGFANCDGLAGNGCEAELASDPAHCGSCTNACTSAPNTSATCVSATCGQGACLPVEE